MDKGLLASASGSVTLDIKEFLAAREKAQHVVYAVVEALEAMVKEHPCDHPEHVSDNHRYDCACCQARVAIEGYDRWEGW